MSGVLLALGIVILTLFLWRFRRTKYVWPPGIEPSDPQTGNLGADVATHGSFHQFSIWLHKRYGPIAKFSWGPHPAVSLGSPEAFNQIIRLQNRPVASFLLFEPLIGMESIQFANDEAWKERKINYYNNAFMTSSIRDMYPLFQRLALELIERIKRDQAETKSVEIFPLVVQMLVKAMATTSLGDTIDDDSLRRLVVADGEIWSEIELRLSIPPTEARAAAFDKNIKEIKQIIRNIYESAKEGKAKVSRNSFIYHLMNAHNMTEEKVLSEIMTVSAGGAHTTGLSVGWALTYLARHPDVQRKAKEELKRVAGDAILPTYEDLFNLKYMKQVYDEAMRCGNLAPFAARYSNEEVKIDKYLLPPKTMLIINMGVVMQNPDFFPNPSRFDPDRFSESEKKKRHALSFTPFGFAGKRICPGNKFAESCALLFLSSILQSFDLFSLSPSIDEELEQRFGLVTIPKGKVLLSFVPTSKPPSAAAAQVKE